MVDGMNVLIPSNLGRDIILKYTEGLCMQLAMALEKYGYLITGYSDGTHYAVYIDKDKQFILDAHGIWTTTEFQQYWDHFAIIKTLGTYPNSISYNHASICGKELASEIAYMLHQLVRYHTEFKSNKLHINPVWA